MPVIRDARRDDAASGDCPAARLLPIRAAKACRRRAGLPTDLTPDELDAIVPAVECRRTRERTKGADHV